MRQVNWPAPVFRTNSKVTQCHSNRCTNNWGQATTMRLVYAVGVVGESERIISLMHGKRGELQY